MWQFPNCLGVVDEKYIAITPPPGTGSFFYKCKGFYSMVLMVIANANYDLPYITFETNGRVSDSGVIEKADFHWKTCNGSLYIPVINPKNRCHMR